MFSKLFKFMFVLLMVVLFSSNFSEAQTKKTTYPIFSISPIGGVQFPVGQLNDRYGVSWNAGIDLSLKINRETAFYLNAEYYDMPLKTGLIGGDGSYIAITAGPRYYFGGPKLKAQFFLEAGIGAYIFNEKEYSPETDPAVLYPSVSNTGFGVNVGPGVTIPLGGSIDLLMKSKLHYAFLESGSHTFISAVVGVEFRL